MTPPFLPLQGAKRCWVLLLLLLGALISAELVTMVAAVDAEEECSNPNKVRLVTQEELAMKNGVDGSDIWLSIIGEVYDVTNGVEFYGPGSGYGIFAGRDASVTFVTGKFNEEEAKKGLDSLSINELGALEHWRDFYEKNEKYQFIGLLVDPRYYNEEGKLTTALLEYREREETSKEMKRQFHEDEKLRAEVSKEKRRAAKAEKV